MKKNPETLLLLSLFCGFLLTAWGLWHLHWPQDIPWLGKRGLFSYVYFVAASTALVLVGSVWSKKNPLFVAAGVAAGVALLAGVLWPLFTALWFFVASSILGRSVLAVLRLRGKEDNWTTSFLVGAGLYGTVVGLLAHLPINYPGVYGTLLALPVALGWRVVAEQYGGIRSWIALQSSAQRGVNKLDVAIAVVALIYFVVALMPELEADALAMHLLVPIQLAARHRWGFDPSTYVWTVMPMLGDWIFSVGNMLGGETAARLINVGFIFVLSCLVREIVLWAGGSPVGARWAVLLFLSTPLTFAEGSALFIEPVWASFVVAGTYEILKSCSTSGESRLELPGAGLLLGYALAAKAVTYTALPVLLSLLIWQYRSWYKAISWSRLALGLVLFFAVGAIPYVTAWRLTGNPVFPFFNKIFQSAYYPAVNFDPTAYGKGLPWNFLYRVTFQSGKYLEANAGASGFQWLLLFISSAIILLAGRRRRGIALFLIGILAVASAFHFTSYLRYVFPSWIILTAAFGVALSSVLSRPSAVKISMCAAFIVTVGLNLLFLNAGAQYGDFPLGSIGSESLREQYLLKRLPIRNAVELVNQLDPWLSPVAVFAYPETAGLVADTLSPTWYDTSFEKKVFTATSTQDFANILLNQNVNYIIFDPSWAGLNSYHNEAAIEGYIDNVSKPIADYGSISVREIKSEYLFKTELLANPNFKSISGWTLSPGAKYFSDTGVVLVNVASPATQAVLISPRRLYLNTVVARCETTPTLGRVQVNWLDRQGRFVGADIDTFTCSSVWTPYKMEVPAPSKAYRAVVYVSGQSSAPLEFNYDSLR